MGKAHKKKDVPQQEYRQQRYDSSFCVHKDPVQYKEKITVKEKYNVVSMILHKGVFTD